MDDRRSDLNAFYWLFYIERQREFWVSSDFLQLVLARCFLTANSASQPD
jgi:hypothetical protein